MNFPSARQKGWIVFFPLVRHLSSALTPLLLRLPVTPNQITALSLILGLGCAACYAFGEAALQSLGAGLLILSYVLDNCDGEIARTKGLATRFGAFFDTFCDWVVHAAFFAALGLGLSRASGENFWLWIGLIGAAGGTVNYFLGLYLDWREGGEPTPPEEDVLPRTPGEIIIYIFRELFRADFCFIALILALTDLSWTLAIAGAIGAQVYWVLALVKGARSYHV